MNICIQFIILSAICVIIYANTWHCGFVFDDASAIKDNRDLRPSTNWLDLFRNDFWGTPMHKVTGVVGRAELLSSIAFLICLLLYFQLDNLTTLKYWIRIISIGLFIAIGTLCKEQCITIIAVLVAYDAIRSYHCLISNFNDQSHLNVPVKKHPVQNGKQMSSSSIILAKFRVAIQQTNVLSFRKIAGLTTLTLFCGLVMWLRLKVMNSQLPHFTEFDNPAAHADAWTRRRTHLWLIPVNLGLLLFPSSLCADWTLGSIPLITSWLDWRNAVTLVTFILLTVSGLTVFSPTSTSQHSIALVMVLGILIFTFLPASNLFFPVGFVVAERVLYAPSLGFCLALGLGYQRLTDADTHSEEVKGKTVASAGSRLRLLMHFSLPTRRRLCRLLVGFITLAFCLKTIRRNYDWTNEYELFSSALKVNPNNAKMWNNVGHALEGRQQFNEALGYFRKAVQVQPNDIGAHINVGRTYITLGQPGRAEQAYLEALDYFPKPRKGQTYFARVAPKDLSVFINLANLYLNKTPPHLEEAERLLKRAISLRSDFVDAYQNYGSVLMKLGKLDEAESVYRKALEHQPNKADLHYNLAVILLEMKRIPEAVACLETAIQLDPDHLTSLFALASIKIESMDKNQRSQGKLILEQLVQEGFEPEKIHFSLAMLETDARHYERSVEHYKTVLQLEPNHRSALFNLALLYRNELNQFELATPHLERLIELYPDHIKSYLLLGEIELSELKRPEIAKRHFTKAVSLDPTDVSARHSLCVSLAESGDLEEGERCLTDLLQVVTKVNSGTINDAFLRRLKEHLDVVRDRRRKLDKQP